MNDLQNYIALSRYARWLPEKSRRETWHETVDRYIQFMSSKVEDKELMDWETIRDYIEDLQVVPSMRALMTAGPALERDNVCAYNCAYLPVDHPRSFDETFYILLCGTGVGFSVEERYVQKLPIVNEHFEQSDTIIHVGDSKAGWARALRELIAMLYVGQVPSWDVSKVRPAGAKLKIFGGRASGPGPLEDLLQFTVDTFKKAAGRQLTSLECHDLLCKIGAVVVVGGVRRSAMISLSDPHDHRMRDAKHGAWWEDNGYRSLSNNSAVYEERPTVNGFLSEWLALYDSKSGERGFFNRKANMRQAGRSGRRDCDYDFGTNPCSEIILRPYEFCNLTEVVVRRDDTLETLRVKVHIAAVLGTLQSSLTNFKYIRKIWKQNCEEERLLGVSLTGILDNPSVLHLLPNLKEVAIETNKLLAERIGIAASTAITCVKPSGTVSQLVDSASGIHPRHSRFYIRTVRGDIKDPLTQLMIDEGVPHEADAMAPQNTMVFSFPVASPEGSVVREDVSAIEHLEVWRQVQHDWCEHKPSITVSVKEDEWLDVGAWVYKNFDILSGVSFLPFSEHTYKQAPYQECSETEYNDAVSIMPKINWDRLSEFELDDQTTGTQELACVGGYCEIL